MSVNTIQPEATYAEHLKKFGGMATTGEHLGVMVAPPEFESNCPPAWVFVNQLTATVEQIQQALDYASKGRKTWPPKPDGTRPGRVDETKKKKKQEWEL